MRPPQPGFTPDERVIIAESLDRAHNAINSAKTRFRESDRIYAVDKLRCMRRLNSAVKMLDRVRDYLAGGTGGKGAEGGQS